MNAAETTGKRTVKASAGYSITVRVEIENQPGRLSALLERFAAANALLAEINLLSSDFYHKIREITINCASESHGREIVSLVGDAEGVKLLEWRDDTFHMHEGGKLTIEPKMQLKTTDQLSRAYTPGVARVCTAINQEPEKVFEYTIKRNTVAVVSDGSAVLGLGNIGPAAGLPVMEGKAVLFKQFAGVDAFPICLATQDVEEIIQSVKNLAPVFGGINLEDISAPRCFEIENRLQEMLDIPVFHDDQHGTAVVVLAGLLNALKIVGKKISDIKVVVNGFGAGGVACSKILMQAGVGNVVPCDRTGVVYRGRKDGMNAVKEEMAQVMNPNNEQGTLADGMRGADMFLGVSGPGLVNVEMVRSMAKDAIVFALANPVPEIMPDEIAGLARVIATGRSDYANQINNVLCFPGMFRGALDCRARRITDNMKIAAAHAIAGVVTPDELEAGKVIPPIFKPGISALVADRVKEAAAKDGVARLK